MQGLKAICCHLQQAGLPFRMQSAGTAAPAASESCIPQAMHYCDRLNSEKSHVSHLTATPFAFPDCDLVERLC